VSLWKFKQYFSSLVSASFAHYTTRPPEEPGDLATLQSYYDRSCFISNVMNSHRTLHYIVSMTRSAPSHMEACMSLFLCKSVGLTQGVHTHIGSPPWPRVWIQAISSVRPALYHGFTKFSCTYWRLSNEMWLDYTTVCCHVSRYALQNIMPISKVQVSETSIWVHKSCFKLDLIVKWGT